MPWRDFSGSSLPHPSLQQDSALNLEKVLLTSGRIALLCCLGLKSGRRLSQITWKTAGCQKPTRSLPWLLGILTHRHAAPHTSITCSSKLYWFLCGAHLALSLFLQGTKQSGVSSLPKRAYGFLELSSFRLICILRFLIGL